MNPDLTTTQRERLEAAGLLVLRLGAGGIMLFSHGWGKAARFGELPLKFPDPLGVGVSLSLGLAVFAELLCAALIVVGLATRAATVPLLITMGIAAFVIHSADPFGKKELALLFAIPYLTLLLTGPGRYSLDALLWPRLRQRLRLGRSAGRRSGPSVASH